MPNKISTRYKIAIPLLLIGLLITFILFQNQQQPTTQNRTEHHDLYESDDNGYLLFIEAYYLLTYQSQNILEKIYNMQDHQVVTDGLRGYLKSNLPALEKLREGLAKPYTIAPYIDSQSMNITAYQSEMRELGRQLMYNAELDIIDGHPEKAVNTYLDIIDFAQCTGQGGVEITNLVSIAIQGFANHPTNDPILGLIPDLNVDQLNHLIKRLEELDKKAIPYGQVMENERRAFSSNPKDLVYKEIAEFQMRGVMPDQNILYQRRDVQLRNLILQARLERYTRQHNSPPTNLEDIMDGGPVPIDPFTNKPFSFKDGQPYSQDLEDLRNR